MKQRRKVSSTEFHELLLEAAETERRLPPAMRPASVVAAWPEMLPEWLSYPDKKTKTRLARASARQISDYGFVMDVILEAAEDDERRLLWGAAHSAAFRDRGPNWYKLSKILHCDRRTVKRNYEHALACTVYNWNRQHSRTLELLENELQAV